jgi:hypothetical protein
VVISMRDIAFDEVLSGYRRTHAALLDVSRKTNAAVFHEVRGAANSIGFNLWHVARWDDSLFPGLAQQVPAFASKVAPPEQVWTRRGLAKVWGMPEELGGGGAGTGLPRDDAQGLRLPEGGVVIAYAAEVFDAFSRTLDRLDPSLLALEAGPGRSVGSRVIYYWEHAARHLGMVEALRGVFGESGSARG